MVDYQNALHRYLKLQGHLHNYKKIIKYITYVTLLERKPRYYKLYLGIYNLTSPYIGISVGT